MTIEALLDCPADRWESLSDEDLLKIATDNGWLTITRLDQAAKKRETTNELLALAMDDTDTPAAKPRPTRGPSKAVISEEKKRKIAEMAAKAGMSVEGLF